MSRWTFAFVLLSLSDLAAGKDLPVLTKVLYSAFIAEQGANICAIDDPGFRERITGAKGDMQDYADVIRDDVTRGLDAGESAAIVKDAAIRARDDARLQVKRLYRETPEATRKAISAWCSLTVTPLIRQIISARDEHIEEMGRMIEQAKSK